MNTVLESITPPVPKPKWLRVHRTHVLLAAATLYAKTRHHHAWLGRRRQTVCPSFHAGPTNTNTHNKLTQLAYAAADGGMDARLGVVDW